MTTPIRLFVGNNWAIKGRLIRIMGHRGRGFSGQRAAKTADFPVGIELNEGAARHSRRARHVVTGKRSWSQAGQVLAST